jgi:hypothetical protein
MLKQPSAAVGFPQRVVEKGAGLAISPLAGTPNRLFSPEYSEYPKPNYPTPQPKQKSSIDQSVVNHNSPFFRAY